MQQLLNCRQQLAESAQSLSKLSARVAKVEQAAPSLDEQVAQQRGLLDNLELELERRRLEQMQLHQGAGGPPPAVSP